MNKPDAPFYLAVNHTTKNSVKVGLKPMQWELTNVTSNENNQADLATERERQLTTARANKHSRPQSPSFLGHVVGKRGALEAAVRKFLTSGRAYAEVTNITAHAHN